MPKTDVPSPATDSIVHEYFCKPQPGHEKARTERFDAPRYGPDGVRPIGSCTVHRCLDCGAATYDGIPEKELGTRPVRRDDAPPIPLIMGL